MHVNYLHGVVYGPFYQLNEQNEQLNSKLLEIAEKKVCKFVFVWCT